MFFPRTKWSIAFLVIIIIQAAAALVLEAIVFAKFSDALSDGNKDQNIPPATDFPESRAIPTFLSVYIFGFLYEILLAWDALRLKNTIQVLGLCLYNVGILIYSAVQKDQMEDVITRGITPPLNYGELHPGQGVPTLLKPGVSRDAFIKTIRPYLVIVPCIIAAVTVLMAILAWKLYDEFAWTIYKHISADLRMKRRYLTYQIYIALLKFDFFFFLGFTVQFIVIVVDTRDPEFYLTIAAVPITIIVLLLAAFFVRRESVAGMVLIIVLYIAAMAYFVFKLVRIYDTTHFFPTHNREEITFSAKFAPVKKPLTIFAVCTILLLVTTIIVAIMCTINFNKGLKPHIAKRAVPGPNDKPYGQTEMPSLDGRHGGGRMTID